MTAPAVDAHITALPPDQARALADLRALPTALVHRIIALRLQQLADGS